MENKEFYTRYGNPCNEHHGEIYIYCRRPGSLYNLDTIAREEAYTADKIKDLEWYLQQLKQHRQAIAERYQEIATSPAAPFVQLKRENNGCKIRYFLITGVQYLDGHKEQSNCQKYDGKQRHEAIAAYKAYVKAHPGIIAELDIEKGRWER